jgi:magnesium chelatase subunit D
MTAGFRQIDRLLRPHRQEQTYQVYIFTDGRINAGEGASDPFREAVAFFKRQLQHLRQSTCVVDTETGFTRLGMARQLATALNVKYQLA